MSAYWPNPANLADIGIAWIIMIGLYGAGAALRLKAPAERPEFLIIAGWGAWCVIATFWTVCTPFKLGVVAAGFGLLALAGLVIRFDRSGWRWLFGALVVSLPLCLVLSPIRPAEPDTWLNLLPNANYLVDFGVLPFQGGPPSYSFLPAAPYNTQFLSYLGGLLDPDYPQAGMSLDNLLLLVAGGMVIGRFAGSRPTTAIGLGLLLVTLLDPGFVPRIHLAAYGETGLAVTALVAAALFVEAQAAEEGWRWRHMLAIGLVLAAMVNVKQSGFGLVAAVAAAALSTAWAEGVRSKRRALGFVAGSLTLPIALALLWRWYVTHAGVDELKPLPLAAWQWLNIPAILGSMAHTVAEKGVYFGLVGLSFAALPILFRRHGWTMTTRMLAFNLALFAFYTGFLVLTYIGHFPGAWSTEAHSFFRYETHLSLVLMLSVTLALKDLASGLISEHLSARLRWLAVVAVVLAPFGFIRMLRFDLAMPQPLVWDFAKDLVPFLNDDSRLALLLPGDNGSVATMLGDVLRDTAPRRPALDLRDFDRADAASLDEAAAHGYMLAFVSCTPAGLDAVPPNHAALLAFEQDHWISRAIWAYPADANTGRWQHILAWPPLCRVGG